MPVSFHFLYDKLLKSSQLNAGCLQHMHTAILFLKALYQSRAAITILTVMTSPQHVHGKNCLSKAVCNPLSAFHERHGNGHPLS